MTVKRLYLNGPDLLEDLSMLENLPRLDHVEINTTTVEDLAAFSSLRELKSIGISSAAQLKSISGIERCKSLELLRIHGPVKSLEPVRNLAELKAVLVTQSEISDLGPLSQCKNLKVLQLFGAKISDLTPIAGLRNLENLEIESTFVTDISPLSQLVKLRNLDLGGLKLDDWSALSKLTDLEYLSLPRTNFPDLSLVEDMKQLKSLEIWGISTESNFDLSVLGGLSKLERIVLFGTGVTNEDVLLELPALKSLDIRKNESISDDLLTELQAKRPTLRILK